MYQELKVDPNEEIVRVFFRGADQPIAEANMIDFERRAFVRFGKHGGDKEGGLSFCRPKLMSLKRLIEVTRKRDEPLPRGLAYTRALNFLDLGYSFYGDPKKPGHVCMHCVTCDKSYMACECKSPPCPFDRSDPNDDDEVRDILAGLMTVLVEATPTDEILKIFGSDVDESEVVRANNTYISRWSDYKSSRRLSL